MKILHWDVETGPNLAFVWQLYGNDSIPVGNLREQGELLCWTACWDDAPKKLITMSLHHDGLQAMVKGIHALMEEADAIVSYNGKRFDTKVVQTQFVELGLTPPAPWKEVDLYQTVKGNFRWPSSKLTYVLKRLGLPDKLQNTGMELWLSCLAGDDAAWRKMIAYNRQDVRVLPLLYRRLLPWVNGHPNRGLHIDSDKPACRNCGSTRLQRRGTQTTPTQIYPRFQCRACGRWGRGQGTLKPREKKIII